MADWKGTYRFSNNGNGEDNSPNNTEILEKLEKREEDRQEQLRKKKEEDDSFKVQESLQLFHELFDEKRLSIEKDLLIDCVFDKAKVIEHFDNLSIRVTKLQRYVSESAMFLPPYELKTANNILVSLQQKIQEKRNEKIPKKKFAFRSNKKADKKGAAPQLNIDKSKSEDIFKENESKSQDDLIIELAACKFVGGSNEVLQKEGVEINHKDVALADLTDCTVLLRGAPSAIHINKLNNCKIFCGPVPGSIFIRECKNCIFVLACQQLRIHSTTETQFYIHVTSKAIIEDCNTVKFAPYNWNYERLEEHYTLSGLSKERNNWHKVDDFCWLAADAHSPNWSVIDEKERVSFWNV